jgi:hypothetical protein
MMSARGLFRFGTSTCYGKGPACQWPAGCISLVTPTLCLQVFIYRRQSNDSTGGFLLHQKLTLQPGPTADAATQPGKVYAGSLSMSRDGRLVLVSWSVYGEGQTADSTDPYGTPASTFYGSAQLYRRLSEGRYTRAQVHAGGGGQPGPAQTVAAAKLCF